LDLYRPPALSLLHAGVETGAPEAREETAPLRERALPNVHHERREVKP
jgi:hypothetical protein